MYRIISRVGIIVCNWALSLLFWMTWFTQLCASWVDDALAFFEGLDD